MVSVLALAQSRAESAVTERLLGPGFASQANKIMPASTTNALYSYFTTGGSRMKKFFFDDIPSLVKAPFTPFKIMVWSFIILGLILLALYLKGVVGKSKEGFKDSNLQTFNRLLDTLRADDDAKANINDKLLNLQPLTFKQAAYLGPEYESFNIIEAINGQLQVGSRVFFLQIDFVDRDRDKLCNKFEPCLYYKNEAGTLISSNSGKLSEVFQHIGETAFQPTIKNSEAPIVLLLHFVNIPDITEPYTYLSNVANALQVLKPNILSGGFYRSQKEDDLFNLMFKEFGGKIIIGTNIRTSNVARTDTNDDLDYMVHFHYYVPDGVKVDSTITAPYGSKINALIFDYDFVKKMTKEEFIQKYSTFFTILKTPQERNIPPEEMRMFLEVYGVNVITYDYFKDVSENNQLIAKSVRKLYKSGFNTRIDSLKQ